jgi:hypothetical protein
MYALKGYWWIYQVLFALMRPKKLLLQEVIFYTHNTHNLAQRLELSLACIFSSLARKAITSDICVSYELSIIWTAVLGR